MLFGSRGDSGANREAGQEANQEMSAPLLLAFPISTATGAAIRSAGVLALLSMHIGIALTLRLNLITPLH